MQNALLWSVDGWLKCLGGNGNTGSDSCVGSSCVSVVGAKKDRWHRLTGEIGSVFHEHEQLLTVENQPS
jgi:hypothetical protein